MNGDSTLLWDAIIDVYRAFSAVCDKHHLRYWGAYGTLLGAVRHKGFIPWDDDMDIHMLRADYEKFMEIANDELPSQYRLVNFRNTREYNMTFCKVQETRKEVYEALKLKYGELNPHGIYIDVFPVDGIPDTYFGKLILKTKCYLLAFIESARIRTGCHAGLKGWLSEFVGRLLFWYKPEIKTSHDLTKELDSIARRYDARNTGMCARYFTSSIFNFWKGKSQPWTWHVPSAIFKETMTIPFYKVDLPVTTDTHTNLLANFGPDYMIPPSEKDRVSVHSVCEPAPWLYGPTGA